MMITNLMLAALLCAPAAGRGQDDAPDTTARAVVHGTLTDADGSPLTGVEIRLQPYIGPFLEVASTRVGPTGTVEPVPREELERQAEAA